MEMKMIHWATTIATAAISADKKQVDYVSYFNYFSTDLQ